MQQRNPKKFYLELDQLNSSQSSQQKDKKTNMRSSNIIRSPPISPINRIAKDHDHTISIKQTQEQKLIKLNKYAKQLFEKVHGIANQNKNQFTIQQKILEKFNTISTHKEDQQSNTSTQQKTQTQAAKQSKNKLEPQQYNIINSKSHQTLKSNNSAYYTLQDCLQYCLEQYHKKQQQVQKLLSIINILEDIYGNLKQQYLSTSQKIANLQQQLEYHECQHNKSQRIINQLEYELKQVHLVNEKLTIENQYQKYNKSMQIQQMLNQIGQDQKKQYQKLCNIIKMLQKDIQNKDKKIEQIQIQKTKQQIKLKNKYQQDINQRNIQLTNLQKQMQSLCTENDKYKKLIHQIGIKTHPHTYQQQPYNIMSILPVSLAKDKNIFQYNKLEEFKQKNYTILPPKNTKQKQKEQRGVKYNEKQFKIISSNMPQTVQKKRKNSNQKQQSSKKKFKRMRSLNKQQNINNKNQIATQLYEHQQKRSSKCQQLRQNQQQQSNIKIVYSPVNKISSLEQQQLNEENKEKQLYKVTSLSKLSSVSSCTSNNYKFKTTLYHNINGQDLTEVKSVKNSDEEGLLVQQEIHNKKTDIYKNKKTNYLTQKKEKKMVSIGLMTQRMIQQEQLCQDSPLIIKNDKRQGSEIKQKALDFNEQQNNQQKELDYERKQTINQFMINLRTSSSTQKIQTLKYDQNHQQYKNTSQDYHNSTDNDLKIENFFIKLRKKSIKNSEDSSNTNLIQSTPLLSLSPNSSLNSSSLNNSSKNSLHNFITNLVTRRTHKKKHNQTTNDQKKQTQKSLIISRLNHSYNGPDTNPKETFVSLQNNQQKKSKKNFQRHQRQKTQHFGQSKVCYTERFKNNDDNTDNKNDIKKNIYESSYIRMNNKKSQQPNFKKNKMNSSMIIGRNFNSPSVKKQVQKTKDKGFMNSIYQLVVKNRVKKS